MKTTKQMTCQEFSATLEDYYFFDDLVDEQLRSSRDQSKTFLRLLEAEASRKSVALSDVDSFPYEDYWYALYRDSEKGLS